MLPVKKTKNNAIFSNAVVFSTKLFYEVVFLMEYISRKRQFFTRTKFQEYLSKILKKNLNDVETLFLKLW